MLMRKNKTDETLEEIHIISSNISNGTAFLHKGVTNYGFRKLVRYSWNRKCSLHDMEQM